MPCYESFIQHKCVAKILSARPLRLSASKGVWKQYDGDTYHSDGATLDKTSKYSKNQD